MSATSWPTISGTPSTNDSRHGSVAELSKVSAPDSSRSCATMPARVGRRMISYSSLKVVVAIHAVETGPISDSSV